VLDGEIAKYISVARRKGEEWFVGTITNNDARELKIPLTFLSPGKKYEASIYYDDPNSKVRTKISIKRIKVNAAGVIETKLMASGGQAIWIRPTEN
jgi:alpha-glucosidase